MHLKSITGQEWNLAIGNTWIEVEGITLSQLSQLEKDIPYDFTHMWDIRNKTRGKKRNQRIDLNCREQRDGYQKGTVCEMGERGETDEETFILMSSE